MKRTAVIICLMIISCLAYAQESMDKELKVLVDSATNLRGADETRYNQIKDILKQDLSWTPMNETGPLQGAECPHSANIPRFKLNRMLTQIAGERKYVESKGDMLNGTDERYNYSLYERSVRAGKTVSYKLDGRQGVQWIVIVPYDADSGISATVSVNGGHPVDFIPSAFGILSAKISMPSAEDPDTLILTVNGGSRPQSFVIINYNSRQQ